MYFLIRRFSLSHLVKANLCFALGFLLLACEQSVSPPLTPDEALNSFVLADPDIKIELVASEPLVQDPVAVSFDEGGRLWLVEMLGFMADIDGTGELEKVGRISVLFDDDDDGKMDRSTIFLDSLVLPRAIAVIDGGALIAENIPLWYAEDTDGDFKADKKTLIDVEYGGQGMPEHSANGLLRGMDNWYYNAKSKYRYKKIGDEWVKEETEFRGQWGMTQDDAGRLFYNYNWSQLHADLVPPGVLQQNENHTSTSGIDHGLTLDRRVFPIRSNTAINRGYVPGTLDENGSIIEFASACGPMINRGYSLPDSYYGDAFVCEPTANLVKQNKIIENGFMLSAEGKYEDKEFLASTDERFRPISLSSGPDGALYIVDMYKGIIQHGPYMTPYLREETLKRGLDKPIHMGRIWRVSSKNKPKEKVPNLSKMSLTELTRQLGSPNGWTRDTAQRLLVQKNDISVISELAEILTGTNSLAKLHALWTMEGLGYLEPSTLLTSVRSKDPKVAQTSLRLLMASAIENPSILKGIQRFIEENYDEAEPEVKMQMILASSQIDSHVALEISEKFLGTYGELPVARDVILSTLQGREFSMFEKLLNATKSSIPNQNKEIFVEQLVTAITNSGVPESMDYLLSLLDSKEKSEPWIESAIMNGIVNASIDKTSQIALKNVPEIFNKIDLTEVDDRSIINELQKRFTWPGKPESKIAVFNVENDIDQDVFATGRQKYLNLCASCHGTGGEGMSRFAPPLKQSEWVIADEQKLTMIMLHGMEGPVLVNGKEYSIPDILPSMPSFTTLQDADIAAIGTYIRNAWGHSGSEITRRTVSSIRFRTQGKITPWKAVELDTLSFDINM